MKSCTDSNPIKQVSSSKMSCYLLETLSTDFQGMDLLPKPSLMKKLVIILTLALLQLDSYSQLLEKNIKRNKRIELSDLVRELISTDTIPINLNNIDYYGNIDLYQYALDNFPNLKLSSDSLIIVNRKVTLANCRFERWVEFRNFLFKKEVKLNISALLPGPYFEGEVATLRIDHSIFDKDLSLNLSGKPAFAFELTNSSIYGNFALFQQNGYSGITSITRCNFNPSTKKSRLRFRRYEDEIDLDNLQQSEFSIYTNDLVFELYDNKLDFQFNNEQGSKASIKGKISSNAKSNYIKGNHLNSNINLVKANDSLFFLKVFEIRFDQEARKFELTNNDFNVPVALSLGLYLDVLKIYDNKFSVLGFDSFKIPIEENTIYWNDISQGNAGLRTQYYGNFGSKFGFYEANTEEQVGNLLAYKDLVKFYKKFYDTYKINGDIRSSNQVFIKIKDLETRRLKYEYRANPNFNTFFQVKLNQLLKFYTAFGTDPAKALIISIWLLIIFAIFYFFFPSTWDITSKSRLINDFKLLIEKNEHGYFKPFFRLLLGFSISLLNALTLSLNSFVTLGFGEIPTKGLARYVTIIQGFIGWFLLSLFTVALLNQVIF